MKTISENTSENVNKTATDKMPNKRGTRKFLQTLQPSGGDKENLVGTGRFSEKTNDLKTSKPQNKITEVEVKSKEKKSSIVAKINPSLYKKLIIEDLTSTEGPSEKYWEVIAERRRKALVEVLDQNRNLHEIIKALEEENAACKELLEQTTDLVNTFKEIINEEGNNKSAEGDADEKNCAKDSDSDEEKNSTENSDFYEENSNHDSEQSSNSVDCSDNESK